jgi:cytochrome c biogenesis protein CcmG, thiol:disulfide interchange protein DsbE
MQQIKRSFLALLPLILFILLSIFLWRGLSLKPQVIPSAMLNRSVPTFSLPDLFENHSIVSDKLMRGDVSLLHVWASWCLTCRAEHAYLMEIARTKHIPIYAIDYQDKRHLAQAWIHDFGNPYRAIAYDPKGELGLELGVYGTPETFVIDKKGVIRYKRVGEVNRKNWKESLFPLIQQLKQEEA